MIYSTLLPSIHWKTKENRISFENNLFELPNSERPDCHRLKPHSYKSVYGRMYWDRPAPTITRGFGSTGQGRFVHSLLKRTITPHEAARIQFFPDFLTLVTFGGDSIKTLSVMLCLPNYPIY